MQIPIKRFDNSLPMPEYEKGAACFDLYSRKDELIKSGEIKLIPANVAIKVPEGYVMMLFARSSTPMRKGLMLANSVGILDPFFCGDRDEILMELYNFTKEDININKGETLAQCMLVKTEPVTWQEVSRMEDEGVGGYSTDWSK